MNSPYTDTEKALLCDYFDIRRPDRLRDIDVHKSNEGIYVIEDGELPEIGLASAVGRIALNNHSGACLDQGSNPLRIRKNGNHDALIPRHLFSIRWSESYMDCMWTESYYITFFPEFERYVVTATQSPNELFDLDEVAIGWRSAGEPRIRLAEEIVTNSWKILHGNIISRAWHSVERPGLIAEDMVCMWRNKVWSLLLN